MDDSDMEVNIISPKKIRTEYALGEGSFGVVYKAIWTHGKGGNATVTDVAVKILKNPTLMDNAWTEITRMKLLNHPNILSLHGVTFPRGEDAPWIVMEYMPCGDLHSYIVSYPGSGMSSTVMVKFAYGVACGMAYLHHQMNQRHGDLAARNCLVGPNHTIKIGDFGKFEEHYEDCYYNCGNSYLPCPIRWMPPENLPTWNQPKPRFTRKGDIWGYAVLLFEIWSRGRVPFLGLTDSQVLDTLTGGQTPRHHQPICAKWFIINLIDECWQFNPQDRPNFKYIKRELYDYAGHILETA